MDGKARCFVSKSHAPMKYGRPTEPEIMNVELPFSGAGMLYGNDDVVLDVAGGFFMDIAKIKKEFPRAAVFGIDKQLRMPGSPGKPSKEEYAYEDVRNRSRNYFGADIIPTCDIRRGDALNLEGFGDEYFTRVINKELLDVFNHDESMRSYEQARRVLKENGVLAIYNDSAEGLAVFADLASKYDVSEVMHIPQMRTMFEGDVARMCNRYNFPYPKDRQEWMRIESAVENPDNFSSLSGLTRERVSRDLVDSMFRYVFVETEKKPNLKYVKSLFGYAMK